MTALPTVRPVAAAEVGKLESSKGLEITNGEWVEKRMAGERHGAIAVRLIVVLDGHVRPNKLGRVYPQAQGRFGWCTPKQSR